MAANQVVIGGFTITFDGVVPVSGGYQWSYTIVNDGSEKDLSNWVLELRGCKNLPSELTCSRGFCELTEQTCPPNGTTEDEQCSTFYGVKFDDLPPDTLKQTFTFVVPQYAEPTDGCFYLKFGQNKVCGNIAAPKCVDDPPCPPCPKDSMRAGRKVTEQLPLPDIECMFQVADKKPAFHLCVEGVDIVSDVCDQSVELTLCEQTPSEQKLNCLLSLDYVQLSGDMQIIWQIGATLDTVCESEPVELTFMAVSTLSVDEICYFCRGQRPNVTPQDLCGWFDVQFIELTPSGQLTFTVTFTGCN
jgi:hypothetical protein